MTIERTLAVYRGYCFRCDQFGRFLEYRTKHEYRGKRWHLYCCPNCHGMSFVLRTAKAIYSSARSPEPIKDPIRVETEQDRINGKK